MSENNFKWNEVLRFSWSHIIAFLALIFICYVCFMGEFYLSNGAVRLVTTKVSLIALLLVVTFVGAQQMKATSKKFSRFIIVERILLLLSLAVFTWTMIPFNHFWNVLDREESVKISFSEAITGAKGIFSEYNDYAEHRIVNYRDSIEGKYDEYDRSNYVKTLQLQLLSENTDNLQTSATQWIDEAHQDATVWNAFLVGNIKEIDKAVKSWGERLQSFSEYRMSNEYVAPDHEMTFQAAQVVQRLVTDKLFSVSQIYTSPHGLNLKTIIIGLLLFFCLLFPYLVQKRHTKARGYYQLLPRLTKKNAGGNPEETSVTDNDYESKSISDVDGDSHSTDDVFSGTF